MRILLLIAALILSTALASGCSDDDPTQDVRENPEPVEFLNLRVSELEARRALVEFETSIATSCEIEYGLADDALNLRAEDPEMEEGELSIDHQVPLEDLEPETTYFWRGFVVNEAGDEFRSEIQSFTTPAEDGSTPDLVNFAISPNVMQVSSNFGGAANDETWGVLNAFDGQMSTEWSTNGDGDDAMVSIDLGAEKTITHFGFRSRKMADGTSIVESVAIRFDGGDALGPFETPDPDEHYLFEFEEPHAAQIVTIEAVQTTGGNTGAKEIELLGPGD